MSGIHGSLFRRFRPVEETNEERIGYIFRKLGRLPYKFFAAEFHDAIDYADGREEFSIAFTASPRVFYNRHPNRVYASSMSLGTRENTVVWKDDHEWGNGLHYTAWPRVFDDKFIVEAGRLADRLTEMYNKQRQVAGR